VNPFRSAPSRGVRSGAMEQRTFTDGNGTVLLFIPPKNPEFEALEVGEVERRIRVALPILEESAYALLAGVVVTWAPPPAELSDYLAKAIFALDGIVRFIGGAMPDERSFWKVKAIHDDLLEMYLGLGMLRDRVERVCDHEVLEPAPDVDEVYAAAFHEAARMSATVGAHDRSGNVRCRTCDGVWPNGTVRPERRYVRRPLLPGWGGQRPGRGAFLFFVTELLRVRQPGAPKIDAMKIGAKLIDMFWNDGKPSYEDHQLEAAYREGKESSRTNALIPAAEYLSRGRSLTNLDAFPVWVPITKDRPKASEVGSP
jgi:hypothetical protein